MGSHWLTRLRTRMTRRQQRSRNRSAEVLEQRTLLSVNALFSNGTLIVQSDAADSIVLGSIAGVVTLDVNGAPDTSLAPIMASAVESILITGSDADNTIDITNVTAAAFSFTDGTGNPVSIDIDGRNGSDTLLGSLDLVATLRGGDGNDTITSAAPADVILAGDGDDTVTGGAGNDSIDAGDGADQVTGDTGDDTIIGGDGADTLSGGDGLDSILGGDGADVITGDAGIDTIDGGSGSDVINGNDGDDSLLGGIGDDMIFGDAGLDFIDGGVGNDILNGGVDDDQLFGSSGDDVLNGDEGDDVLHGDLGRDTIQGNDGADTVFGGGNDDNIDGGPGDDLLFGNSGDDTINGGSGGGADFVKGGRGNDLINAGDFDSEITPIITIQPFLSVVEGQSGVTPAVLTVGLQRAFQTAVSVQFTTTRGSAVDPSDYAFATGTVTFAPGVTTQTISIDIIGDSVVEGDEQFAVDLFNPTIGSVISLSQAIIQIRNDDAWVAQGPGPTLNGQVENVVPNNEVVGAIHTVVTHPTNADILYVGGTNGGIWRTDNATAGSPSWSPLTDDLTSQSIGALTMDPANPNRLLAGFGRFSSFGGAGGNLDGLALSNNGGNTWQQITDPLLIGRNISGVVLQGNLMLASANFFGPGGGLYRSADNGVTWTFISGTGGLTAGSIFDLVADPGNPNRFYVSVAGVGVFQSDDAGVTWANISVNDGAANGVDATIVGGGNNNTEMAVANNGRLYVAVIINGQPQYIGFTDNGTAWTRMDLPTTLESDGATEGLSPRVKPGGQGAIHFSIVVDPIDPNTVYVAGDRQDSPFPNFLGANDFSGRIFRGDTTITPTGATPSPQWEHMTHSNAIAATPGGGTASSSSPHADSREMAFDAAGNLIEVDDGGVYRRTNPQNNTGDWFSINGNLQVTEFHDIAYDTLSNILIGGAQDTGTPQQLTPGSFTWDSVSTADGGDVAVDAISTPGSSVRYSSFQNLAAFRRRTYDAANTLLNQAFPALAVTGMGAALVPQFVTPVVVNEVDGLRLIIGGANNPYESLDQGDNITELDIAAQVNSDSIAYGGRRLGVDNPEVLYLGAGAGVFVRQAGLGLPVQSAAWPGGTVRDIVLDPDDWMTAYIADPTGVFRTTDAGATWANVTGNLPDPDLRSLEFIPGSNDAVVVGGRFGVFRMTTAAPGVWAELDASLPRVPVYDMDYDAADDVLIAGTLGRGAWLFPSASQAGIIGPGPGLPMLPTPIIAAGDTLHGNEGDDTIVGADGDDLIDGGSGNDSLRGAAGDDVVLGGEGNDLVDGSSGNDTIFGLEGDDNIFGGAGNDELVWRGSIDGTDNFDGGDGQDLLNVLLDLNANSVTVGQDLSTLTVTDGGASARVASNGIQPSMEEVQVNGGLGDDILTLTDINNVGTAVIRLNGEDGADTISAAGAKIGNVILFLNGGLGADTITGSAGGDSIAGGDDDDEINGGNGADTIRGGLGNDLLAGGEGNDIVFGNEDNDTLTGGNGNDLLNGGSGDDDLDGDDGNDTLLGELGSDTLLGDRGDDSIVGGSGADTLQGAAGDDTLDGGANDDVLLGNSGDDVLRGGDGNDIIRGHNGDDTIDGGDGNDVIFGLDGDDGIVAGDGADYVNAGSGDDIVIGGDGPDELRGGDGNDILFGNDGDDTLSGNGGTDTLVGGLGADQFDEPSEQNELFMLSAAVLASLNANI